MPAVGLQFLAVFAAPALEEEHLQEPQGLAQFGRFAFLTL